MPKESGAVEERNEKQKSKRLKSKQNRNQITSYQEIINNITENYVRTEIEASAV
jgi:hypothetical protein